ncbi:hypothetical protein L228DRAFT_141201 [Xylona heveae TC161]|uniref:Uncharacterized protein n=1 Tax=Xylona heveae (strain CBS 132557 / TC161) TaxID=1328760 RepID=A0A165H556_XYLHT|nr:hypothetical protein L228DRAFT_141201 [Xylona heveae TC161]KZF22998.1 hypothetical protein L228DRAFT_141201 [Xylona heveae TC161]
MPKSFSSPSLRSQAAFHLSRQGHRATRLRSTSSNLPRRKRILVRITKLLIRGIVFQPDIIFRTSILLVRDKVRAILRINVCKLKRLNPAVGVDAPAVSAPRVREPSGAAVGAGICAHGPGVGGCCEEGAGECKDGGEVGELHFFLFFFDCCSSTALLLIGELISYDRPPSQGLIGKEYVCVFEKQKGRTSGIYILYLFLRPGSIASPILGAKGSSSEPKSCSWE